MKKGVVKPLAAIVGFWTDLVCRDDEPMIGDFQANYGNQWYQFR